MSEKKNKSGAIALGVAFVWFTTHFGGGFASGAQIYSYYVRYGIWCLTMPALAMLYNTVFFAYSLRFARKHEVYDYRSYNNAFYGKFAPLFSNLFEVLYVCVMCVAPAVAFATGGATLAELTGLPYLLCTFLIGIFIFVVAIFGTNLVRRVASILSVCIIAGLLIVYIPNIIAGFPEITGAAQSMMDQRLPFGDALYSAFLYGTFQLSNIAVFVQHAKSFEKPNGSRRPEHSHPVHGAERRRSFLHDPFDFSAYHSRRSIHGGQYGGGHGEEDLQGNGGASGRPKGKTALPRNRKGGSRGAAMLYSGFWNCPVRAADADSEGVQPDRLSGNSRDPDSLSHPHDSNQI